MKRNLLLFLILPLLFPSCQKRVWDNPYDPECPKELFTPTNFKAVQEGATIKLTWLQPVSTISKFKLVKQVSGGQETPLPEQTKEKRQYIDPSVLVGGKVIVYRLIAYAGTNKSYLVSVSITPITNPPSVSTTALTILTSSTATSGGTVTNDGASAITARGVCWSTSPNPTTANSKTSEAIGTGTGSFTSSLTGLNNNIMYYVRAYATNAVGTSYGSESNFTLYLNVPGPSVTDIDGNAYRTVKIGNQVWMAENLRTTRYRDGTIIPYVKDGTSWSNLSSGAYCYYAYDSSFGPVYGPLYNYYAVVDNHNLCPSGWHIPSDTEWQVLSNYLGGADVAGGKMKEIGSTHWTSPNIDADNSSGFSAFGGGWAADSGGCYYWKYSGDWWSSTQMDSNNSYLYVLAYDTNKLIRGYGAYYGKKGGLSVRCIKD